MKSSKNLSQNTISSRFNKILITAVALTTLMTTFTSCTADEIPREDLIINSDLLDEEPLVKPIKTSPPPTPVIIKK